MKNERVLSGHVRKRVIACMWKLKQRGLMPEVAIEGESKECVRA